MRKYALFICLFASFLSFQCTTVRQASRQVYLKQIQEIEDAYNNKEISKAEYLRLKMQAENAYHQREATIAAGAASRE